LASPALAWFSDEEDVAAVSWSARDSGAIDRLSNSLFLEVLLALAFLFLLVLLRALLRQEWAAAIASVFFLTVFFSVGSESVPVALVIVLGGTVFLLIRLGLLWLVVAFVLASLLSDFPLTTQSSAWYAGISPDRNSVDGRDGVLRLLHFRGGPPGFWRRCA
jgi:hypothetical protein